MLPTTICWVWSYKPLFILMWHFNCETKLLQSNHFNVEKSGCSSLHAYINTRTILPTLPRCPAPVLTIPPCDYVAAGQLKECVGSGGPSISRVHGGWAKAMLPEKTAVSHTVEAHCSVGPHWNGSLHRSNFSPGRSEKGKMHCLGSALVYEICGLSNLILKLQDEILNILHKDSLTFPVPVYICSSGEPPNLSPLEKRSAWAGATLQCCLPSAETQLFPFPANSDSNWQRSRGTKRRSKSF